MGGGQSREKAIQRWLTQPKDLTVLTSTRGGLNSHLSIGLFRLAIANQFTSSEKLLKTLSNSVTTAGQSINNFIITYFPALVIKQGKDGPEYLECFVVLDHISLLISCRPAVGGSCCGVGDQGFDLRISLTNIENATLSETNYLTIQYSMEPEGISTIQLRLTDAAPFQKLKCAHAILHLDTPSKWQYENVIQFLPIKDIQEKGLSKLFLCHLFSGARYDLTVLDIPPEWTATFPPMQHVHPEYYLPENKPNIPPPPPRDMIRTKSPALQEYVTLCRGENPPREFWSDVPIEERIKFCFPTPYLTAVVDAISGTLCLNHSTVGDPREINVLKLHGSVYCKSLGSNRDSLSRKVNTRPGYFILSDCQIASGALLWGSYPRSEPLRCNPKIVCAILKTLQYNSWCQFFEFGDCFIPEPALLDVLPLMKELCRSNTSLISLAFPPRATTAPPIQSNSPTYKLWMEISEALIQNPRPLFTSLDFTNCHLGDDGVRAILPGLKRIFSMRNTLKSLKFTNNNLSSVGVTLICDALLAGDTTSPFWSLSELSFGMNPWCSNPATLPMRQINEIIKLSPKLQTLNFHSSGNNFPINLIKNQLMESTCPLTDLVLGGTKIKDGGAYDYVRSVIDICCSKVNTLKSISLQGIELDNAGAIEIINSVGSIDIDFSQKGLGTMYQVYVSPQSRIVGLNCSINPFYVLHWWTSSFPTYLIELNLSNLDTTQHPDLFQPLTTALVTTQTPLALQSINISKIVTVPQSVIRFLEVCLLCPLIQLKKLDITDCRLGDLVFHCLGHCLRKNRTLTSLKFDGQDGSVLGWAAFRGCLYGNKKLIDIPYPYTDVAKFYETADKHIIEGYAKIPEFKAKIKSAYRSKNIALGRRHIDAMVAVKIKYKEWERAIGRTSCVLQEIFNSIEQNILETNKILHEKKLMKLQSPKAYEMKQKICIKEGKLLIQLIKIIEKYRNKVLDNKNIDLNIWNNIDEMIRTTCYLFIPRNFHRFITFLEYTGIFLSTIIPSNNILLIIDKITMYINQLELKAKTLWNQNLYELAQDIMSLATGPVLELKNYQFIPTVKKSSKKNKDKDNDDSDVVYYDENEHNDHDHDHDDNDNNNEEKEKDKKEEENEKDDNDNNNENQESVVDDDIQNDDDVDLNDGLEDVEMYGGAGPQDLPDGGPDDDPSSTTAHCTFDTNSEVKKVHQTPKKAPDFESLMDECLVKCPTLLLPLNYDFKQAYATISSSFLDSNSLPRCTLVTQCSIDRFPQLESQILAWDSAVSVALYIPSPHHTDVLLKVDQFISQLRKKLSASCRHYLIVISLLFGHESESHRQYWDFTSSDEQVALYPINNLRNLAASAAMKLVNSPLLFLVDVDFIPSVGLSTWIETTKSLVSRCNSGEIFVVPAFECDRDYQLDPQDALRSLEEGLYCGDVTPFHVSHFPAGHQPTDFSRWLTLSLNSNNPAEEQPYSYPITYHNYYEPYVILSSQRFIPYDERFRGYGMNKCIHLKGLHTHGATFHVITKYFVLAYTHERSLSHQVTYHLNSKLRRYIIAKLYQIACKELLLISSSPSPSSPTSGISLSSNTMTLLSNENSMNSYLSIQQFLMNSLKKYFIFSKTELEEKKKKTYWEVEIPRNLETTSN